MGVQSGKVSNINCNSTQGDNLLKKQNSNRVLNANDNVIPINSKSDNTINSRN